MSHLDRLRRVAIFGACGALLVPLVVAATIEERVRCGPEDR